MRVSFTWILWTKMLRKAWCGRRPDFILSPSSLLSIFLQRDTSCLWFSMVSFHLWLGWALLFQSLSKNESAVKGVIQLGNRQEHAFPQLPELEQSSWILLTFAPPGPSKNAVIVEVSKLIYLYLIPRWNKFQMDNFAASNIKTKQIC